MIKKTVTKSKHAILLKSAHRMLSTHWRNSGAGSDAEHLSSEG